MPRSLMSTRRHRARSSLRGNVCHHHKHGCEQHVMFVRREHEDRTESVKPEVERRHGDVIRARIMEVGAFHSTQLLPSVRRLRCPKLVELAIRAGDLDNRRTAMRSRLPELSKAQSALEAKCQPLQRAIKERGGGVTA